MKGSGEGEGALGVWIVLGSGGNEDSLSSAEPSSARLLLLWPRPPPSTPPAPPPVVSPAGLDNLVLIFLEEFSDFLKNRWMGFVVDIYPQ